MRPERRGRRRLGTENPEVQRRLLDTAGEIVAADGWPALRIEDLVRRAGLSVGTFYLYFDKQGRSLRPARHPAHREPPSPAAGVHGIGVGLHHLRRLLLRRQDQGPHPVQRTRRP
ncbi:TetR/AcrR family transcriptional regulator [Nonomuraea jabiensis]|uniref:TetR/AcrR family transcriptional regulator n=1 Tax=Nonomuraea jabiensis TaxID=882448 RepID=UPI003D7269F9